jgi:hypothetical protein
MLEALIDKFAQIEDPRCDWRVEHKLLDILVIAVCAVIGEAESFEDIALYGRCKRDWLQRFLELPGGIPSHDTFRRVLMLIDPERFERCFLDWVRAVCRPGEGALRQVASTARPCGARSIARMAARPCAWSARSRWSTGWCWRSVPRRPGGASFRCCPACSMGVVARTVAGGSAFVDDRP